MARQAATGDLFPEYPVSITDGREPHAARGAEMRAGTGKSFLGHPTVGKPLRREKRLGQISPTNLRHKSASHDQWQNHWPYFYK